ncbi:hypothetical protein O3P69_008787 [Scylla paramamosain]|uniref:Trimethylguanosine synthase n=1 Tax=Scylla paramamosain TaxID=85552 RepID=A0AAW0TP81_SCYPA
MAVPHYVSTEWVGLRHATLRFRPSKVQVESPKAHDGQEAGEEGAAPDQGFSVWSWLPGSWSDGIPWFSSPKDPKKPQDQPPVETHKIECYLSAVYIGEYGERKSKVSKASKKSSKPQEGVEETAVPSTGHQADVGGQNTAPDNSLTPLEGNTDDLRPPGIESEVWSAWLEYWEVWKEVLIPLSWVHKYRGHCTPEYIVWHDSYLQDYPEVLPWITEELGVSELQEDTTGTSQLGSNTETNVCKKAAEATGDKDSSSDSEFDMTEFYDFLNGDIDSVGERAEQIPRDNESWGKKDESVNANVNATLDGTSDTKGGADRKMLDDLYAKHTKKRYLVHLRTFLHSSGVESSQDLDAFFKTEAGIDFHIETAAIEAETNTTKLSDDTRNSQTITNTSTIHDKANKLKSQEQTEDTREGTRENGTGTTNHEELESSPIPQGDSSREGQEAVPCKDERTEPHASEETGAVVEWSGSEESTQEEALNASGVSVSASQEHKTSKRRRRKKDTIKFQGTSWALQYVQGKTAVQSEVPQPTERPTVSPEPHRAVPGSPSLVFESREATAVTLEPAGTCEALPRPSEKENIRTAEVDDRKLDEEEDDTMQAFIDDLRESERIFWKRHQRNQERQAELQALSEPHTRLGRLLADCRSSLDRAAVSLQSIFLSFTALHFLNVALPGIAVIEYESSVTEEVPGERKRLKYKFDEFTFDQRMNLERYLPRIAKFCLRTMKDVVVPMAVRHFTNLGLLAASEIELQFPPVVFGVRWLPLPEPSFSGDGKNIKRHQRRFHRFLEEQDPNVSPSCTVQLRGKVMHRVNLEPDPRKPQRVYQEVVREKSSMEDSRPHLTACVLHLGKSGESGDSSAHSEVEWQAAEITFDKDGNFCVTKDNSSTSRQTKDSDGEVEVWNRIISGCQRLSYWEKGSSLPLDLSKDIQKYWAQRYRLFLNYDQGIKLDSESWYSVTPEFLAAHQARRCRSAVVVDAMCGAGGNAIQLAKTCGQVIAIDKDPRKVELARHNAQVYGVADRIDFRVGNFFKLASSLKADVVYLSPPWGGMEYLEEEVYNVYHLGGTMNCARLLRAAQSITPNVALYLPRNSDVCQVIALAGLDGAVDIETTFMGPKKKAITAYFGDLAAKCF